MKIRALILLIYAPFFGYGQNLEDVKHTVDLLTSETYSGRGYVNDGSNKAGDFLSKSFSEYGLQPIGNSYFQPFSFPVNTFPVQTVLTCDGKVLEEGKDYIVDPGSGSSAGRYRTYRLDSTDFQNIDKLPKPGKGLAVVDLDGIDSPEEVGALHSFKQAASLERPLILSSPNKLMWSVSDQRYRNAIIEVAKPAFCKNAKRVELSVKNVRTAYTARNVIGKIEGRSSDSCFVLTAHYDHLGMLGGAIFPGASDNSSGVAMLLDLANYYSQNKPKYDIVFIAFAAEEAGLIGSKYFVEHPLFKLEKIKFLINLDLMGSAERGITVVNGRLFPDEMAWLSGLNTGDEKIPKIKLRGKAANSDHYWFSEAGVPAIFIYTEGTAKAYHAVDDTPEKLDWARYDKVFQLLTDFLETF